MNDGELTRELAEAIVSATYADAGMLALIEQHLAIIRSYPLDAGPRPDAFAQLAATLPGVITERLEVCQPQPDTVAKLIAAHNKEPRNWSAMPQALRRAAASLGSVALSLQVAAALAELRNELDARGWL